MSRDSGTYESSERDIDGLAASTAGYGLICNPAGFFTSPRAKTS